MEMFDLNLDRAKADAQPCAQSGNHCAQIGIFARFFNPRWPPCPQSLYSLAGQVDFFPNSAINTGKKISRLKACLLA